MDCVVTFTLNGYDPSRDYVRTSHAGDIGIIRCQAQEKWKLVFILENLSSCDSDKTTSSAILIGKTDPTRIKHLAELNFTKTCSKIGILFTPCIAS